MSTDPRHRRAQRQLLGRLQSLGVAPTCESLGAHLAALGLGQQSTLSDWRTPGPRRTESQR